MYPVCVFWKRTSVNVRWCILSRELTSPSHILGSGQRRVTLATSFTVCTAHMWINGSTNPSGLCGRQTETRCRVTILFSKSSPQGVFTLHVAIHSYIQLPAFIKQSGTTAYMWGEPSQRDSNPGPLTWKSAILAISPPRPTCVSSTFPFSGSPNV